MIFIELASASAEHLFPSHAHRVSIRAADEEGKTLALAPAGPVGGVLVGDARTPARSAEISQEGLLLVTVDVFGQDLSPRFALAFEQGLAGHDEVLWGPAPGAAHAPVVEYPVGVHGAFSREPPVPGVELASGDARLRPIAGTAQRSADGLSYSAQVGVAPLADLTRGEDGAPWVRVGEGRIGVAASARAEVVAALDEEDRPSDTVAALLRRLRAKAAQDATLPLGGVLEATGAADLGAVRGARVRGALSAIPAEGARAYAVGGDGRPVGLVYRGIALHAEAGRLHVFEHGPGEAWTPAPDAAVRIRRRDPPARRYEISTPGGGIAINQRKALGAHGARARGVSAGAAEAPAARLVSGGRARGPAGQRVRGRLFADQKGASFELVAAAPPELAFSVAPDGTYAATVPSEGEGEARVRVLGGPGTRPGDALVRVLRLAD